MRGVSLAGLALGALSLAAACGGDGGIAKTATPSPGPLTGKEAFLATMDARPSATATLTPLIADQSVRACQAADLTSDVRSNAFTNGGLTLSIDLGNSSQTPCKISRLPDITFVGPAGSLVPIDVSLGDSIFAQPLLLPPDLGTFDHLGHLKPGQVRIHMSWHIHNAAGTCPTPPPEGDAVRLGLPDGGGDFDVDVTKELSYGGLPGYHGIRPCNGTVAIYYGPY